jgi:tRNA U34 5-carboxymethylaminomethyl modifying enzyme MnmG/GidA
MISEIYDVIVVGAGHAGCEAAAAAANLVQNAPCYNEYANHRTNEL